MNTPDKFDEPGFVRIPIVQRDQVSASPGIVILIADLGTKDMCLAGFASDNMSADIQQRQIFRATHLALLEEPQGETLEDRVKQSGGRMLRYAALSKKYGITPENIVPPGMVGELRR